MHSIRMQMATPASKETDPLFQPRTALVEGIRSEQRLPLQGSMLLHRIRNFIMMRNREVLLSHTYSSISTQ
jgi:hypothetical protein